MASLDDEAKTPEGAFWIAVAGPLVSLVLFGLLTLLASSGFVAGPIAAITSLLAYINLILATFNMIPGLPLDGGNVLKAIVWKISGNRYRGIRWASRSGQVIGWLAIGLGLLSVLGLSNVGSVWTLIIGWFILQNAGRSAQMAVVQETLSGLTAADAVVENSPIVDANNTLRDLANTAIVADGNKPWHRFLVTASDNQLAGSIDLDALKTVPTEQWSMYQVRDFLKPIEQDIKVHADLSLLDVIQKMERQKTQTLAVTTANGALVGLLEKSEIISLLQQKAQVQSV